MQTWMPWEGSKKKKSRKVAAKKPCGCRINALYLHKSALLQPIQGRTFLDSDLNVYRTAQPYQLWGQITVFVHTPFWAGGSTETVVHPCRLQRAFSSSLSSMCSEQHLRVYIRRLHTDAYMEKLLDIWGTTHCWTTDIEASSMAVPELFQDTNLQRTPTQQRHPNF